jgi:hypothetical protein
MNLHSENINEIASALAKVQGEIKAAQKDGANPHFKSKFASLNSHWEVCRAVLSKNGLMITQLSTVVDDGKNVLVTMLCHSSGQWFKSSMILKPVKDDPQGMGSCLSYARRYMLSAIVGTTADDEDDDAEAASGRGNFKQTKSTKLIDPSKVHELMKMRAVLKEDDKSSFDKWIKTSYDADELAFLPNDAYEKVNHILKNKVGNENN